MLHLASQSQLAFIVPFLPEDLNLTKLRDFDPLELVLDGFLVLLGLNLGLYIMSLGRSVFLPRRFLSGQDPLRCPKRFLLAGLTFFLYCLRRLMELRFRILSSSRGLLLGVVTLELWRRRVVLLEAREEVE